MAKYHRMPVLPKEIEIAPDDLFDLPPELRWYVAHVRSRQEKVLGRFLLGRGIPFYLPQTPHELHSGSRTRTSFLPLFPGYVFLRGERNARDAVVRSDLAVHLLDVTDQEILGHELRQLRELQQSGASLIRYDAILPGEPVRVTDGVFAGYMGVVLRSARGDRLVISISLLRKNVAVEFGRGSVTRTR